MTKTRLILGTGVLAMASGIAAVAAQHVERPTAHHQMAMLAGLHSGCAVADGAGNTSTSHVPAHVAQMLELTAVQMSEIDRMAAELCQAANRTHEAIHNVLTPDQRAKVAKLHGEEQGASGLHALMKKLHGGGK